MKASTPRVKYQACKAEWQHLTTPPDYIIYNAAAMKMQSS